MRSVEDVINIKKSDLGALRSCCNTLLYAKKPSKGEIELAISAIRHFTGGAAEDVGLVDGDATLRLRGLLSPGRSERVYVSDGLRGLDGRVMEPERKYYSLRS